MAEEQAKDETTQMKKKLKNVGSYLDYQNSMSMEQFVDMVDSRLDFYKVTDEKNKNMVLRNTVAGTSVGKILKLADNKIKNYSETMKLLMLVKDGKAEKEWFVILRELGKMNIRNHVDLSDYFSAFCEKAIEIGDKISIQITIQYFINGLPDNIADYCTTQECSSLTDVYTKACLLYRKPEPSRTEHHYDKRNTSQTRRVCYFCQLEGHNQRDCRQFLAAQQEARNETANIAKIVVKDNDKNEKYETNNQDGEDYMYYPDEEQEKLMDGNGFEHPFGEDY